MLGILPISHRGSLNIKVNVRLKAIEIITCMYISLFEITEDGTILI